MTKEQRTGIGGDDGWQSHTALTSEEQFTSAVIGFVWAGGLFWGSDGECLIGRL